MKSQASWHLKSARRLGPLLERGDNYTIARSRAHPTITVMFIGGVLGHVARVLDNHEKFEGHDRKGIVTVAKTGRLFHSFERDLQLVEHVDKARKALAVARVAYRLLARYAPK